MARKKKIDIAEGDNMQEQERIALAVSMMQRKNNHYKPIPKFKGGCKNC